MTEDQSSFIERMYLEMYDMLMAYASSSLENESLAEEAVQEAFRIACLKPDEFCTSENPRGWIVLVLKNTIRNTKKNRANANRIFTTYICAQGGEIAITEDRVSLEVMYGNMAVSEEFQLIKELAVDGRSHLEMAQSRGITINACKKRVQRAKETLKTRIKI